MEECVDVNVLQEDIEWIVKNNTVMANLENKTIMVTGATGLIGAQIVRTLLCYNNTHNAKINIIAMARNEKKVTEMFEDILETDYFEFYISDINDSIKLSTTVDYIIHAASATSSQYFVMNPVETIWTVINGTKNILDFAKGQNLKGFVYLSSLEVYGTPVLQSGLIREIDYGYIDPLNVRSSYSEGKRLTECLCVSYAKEYGVPVKIARLSQTFGPGVAYDDNRVFAEFARCVIEQRDIILHTEGKTVRSYCYTKDAVNAILYILLKGTVAEAYNVTNMDTAISINDMAQLVCETVGLSKIKVIIDTGKDISRFGYNPEMIIKLNSHKLYELGWSATVGLEEMYRRMVWFMQGRRKYVQT